MLATVICLTVAALQIALLLWASPSYADSTTINVTFIEAEALPSYKSSRVYSGRSMAARSAQLGFNRGAAIDSIHVDIGDKVVAGDVLATLDTRALLAQRRQAQADVTLAQANHSAVQAETQLSRNTDRRFRKLHAQGHISKQELDETSLALRAKMAGLNVARAQIERAKATLAAVDVAIAESSIIAPFSGTIQSRMADPGTQLAPGQPVLKLVESSHIELHIGVPTRSITALRPGENYPVTWGSGQLMAELRAVLPEVDPKTRTVTAVLTIADESASIPMGEVVELRLDEQVDTQGFWLPIASLTESDRGLWGVYVINAANQVERRLVEIIHSESDRAFVRGTLMHRDRVVNTGVHRIVPGQGVNATAAQSSAAVASS